MELRDAAQKFAAAGLKLYAISYDDVEALAAFATANRVTYRLLSDVDSTVIREYGILNTQVDPGDGPIYGIPYPGAYVTDENGVVIEKFFHDSYKRDRAGSGAQQPVAPGESPRGVLGLRERRLWGRSPRNVQPLSQGPWAEG